MIQRLRLNRTYFAGKGGLRVVQQDGSELRVAEGYPASFAVWPTSVDGEIIDSRGHVVAVVTDKVLRIAEDKMVTL